MDVHAQTFYAHSTPNPDKSDWQPLREHLEAVAEIAARNASAFSADALAHLAGLLHDLGKYTDEFQRRITGDAIRVDQAGPGGRKVSRPTRGAWVETSFAVAGSVCWPTTTCSGSRPIWFRTDPNWSLVNSDTDTSRSAARHHPRYKPAGARY